jgi:hypothetical protein
MGSVVVTALGKITGTLTGAIGDDRSVLLVPDPVRLAILVEPLGHEQVRRRSPVRATVGKFDPRAHEYLRRLGERDHAKPKGKRAVALGSFFGLRPHQRRHRS